MKLSEALAIFGDMWIAPCFNSYDGTLSPESEARKIICDALRWRKWPEEKPTESGFYLCRCVSVYSTDKASEYKVLYIDITKPWTAYMGVTHWLPINGPEVLP